jgi:hypothetical protein
MNGRTVGLCDNDGDGIIIFEWDENYPGINIELTDFFGNVAVGTFYKRDLVKKLKKLLKKLEQE